MEYGFKLEGLAALIFLLLVLGVIVSVVVTPIVLITKIIAHAKRRADYEMQLRARTVIAEYEPPAGLKPAEIGFLFDTNHSGAEAFATIVDLGQRGYIILNKQDDAYRAIITKKSDSDLVEYEKIILSELKTFETENLTRSKIDHMGLTSGLILRQSLQREGFLNTLKSQIKQRVGSILGIMFLLMLLFPILPLWPNSFSAALSMGLVLVFFSWIYFILALILISTFEKIAGERWLATPKLKTIWHDIEGYRIYLRQVEADNLTFESKAPGQIATNKSLPYAIALGVSNDWKKYV